MEKYFIGFLADNSALITKGGKITLTSVRNGEVPAPFLPALERVGYLALISGDYDNKTVYESRIIETTPLLTSTMIKVALEKTDLTWTQLEKAMTEARDIVIGDVTGPVSGPPPGPPAPRPKLVIDIGHRKLAPGACSTRFQVCEFQLNTEIADKIKTMITTADVVITSRASNSDGQRELAAKINALNPDFILSLHANSAASVADGTEMLYFHLSSRSKQMAEVYQRHVLAALQFRDRKILPRTGADRGGALLQYTQAPCVLAEPFFLSNDNETQFVVNNKDLLAGAYARAVDEIVSTMF